SSASNPGSASYRLEALLAWNDLGLSGSGNPVKVMAVIVHTNGAMGNQFLPPLAPGTPDVGVPPYSLKTVAGQQYVTEPTALAVPPAAPARRLPLVAAPNPFRDSTTLRFGLAHAARAQIDVLDVSGRRVRALGA